MLGLRHMPLPPEREWWWTVCVKGLPACKCIILDLRKLKKAQSDSSERQIGRCWQPDSNYNICQLFYYP